MVFILFTYVRETLGALNISMGLGRPNVPRGYREKVIKKQQDAGSSARLLRFLCL
jgi:hypothetical protein